MCSDRRRSRKAAGLRARAGRPRARRDRRGVADAVGRGVRHAGVPGARGRARPRRGRAQRRVRARPPAARDAVGDSPVCAATPEAQVRRAQPAAARPGGRRPRWPRWCCGCWRARPTSASSAAVARRGPPPCAPVIVRRRTASQAPGGAGAGGRGDSAFRRSRCALHRTGRCGVSGQLCHRRRSAPARRARGGCTSIAIA